MPDNDIERCGCGPMCGGGVPFTRPYFCPVTNRTIEPGMRNAQQDYEVTVLLRDYDRIVARLMALGVDVAARDRANAAYGKQEPCSP